MPRRAQMLQVEPWCFRVVKPKYLDFYSQFTNNFPEVYKFPKGCYCLQLSVASVDPSPSTQTCLVPDNILPRWSRLSEAPTQRRGSRINLSALHPWVVTGGFLPSCQPWFVPLGTGTVLWTFICLPFSDFPSWPPHSFARGICCLRED